MTTRVLVPTKIRVEPYHLPHVKPVLAHSVLGSGANEPLLMTVIDTTTGKREDCVVKLRASERMTTEACAREPLAAFVAMEMELAVGKPVSVEIDAAFVESQRGMDWYQRLSRSLGENFGSLFIQGQLVNPKTMQIARKDQPQAADIIAFDTMVQNSDRVNIKPNLIVDGKDMHLIDHELSFGFSVMLFPSAQPWVLSENDIRIMRNHLLYSKVKSKHFDVVAFEEKMKRMNEAFWEKAWTELPEAWKNEEQFGKIKDTMLAIRANRNTFVNQVSQTLS